MDKIFIAIFGPLLGGILILFIKHLSNGNKHPSKKEMVSREVCKSERKRIEDCIESAMKLQIERLNTLTEKLEETKTLLSKNIEHLTQAVDKLVDGEFNRG